MRKTILICIGLVCIFTATNVFAAENKGTYISARFGWATTRDASATNTGADGEMSFESRFALVGAVGYDFGKYRVEGEVFDAYSEVDDYSTGGSVYKATDGTIDSIGLMVNGYIEFENQTAFTPYVMAGLGLEYVELNDLVLQGGPVIASLANDPDDTVWAFQFGGGVDYYIKESFSLNISYQYHWTEDLDYYGAELENGGHRFPAAPLYVFF